MRWQPSERVCTECGFDWGCSRQAAIDLIAAGPDAAAEAMAGVVDPMRQAGARWSASMYVWHLVDVLRIGTERLLTLTTTRSLASPAGMRTPWPAAATTTNCRRWWA